VAKAAISMSIFGDGSSFLLIGHACTREVDSRHLKFVLIDEFFSLQINYNHASSARLVSYSSDFTMQ
jgi:hypothetical protein